MFSIFHALLPFHLFIVGLVGEGEGEDALTDEVASVILLNNLLRDPCHSDSNEGSAPFHTTPLPQPCVSPCPFDCAEYLIKARFCLSLSLHIPVSLSGTDYESEGRRFESCRARHRNACKSGTYSFICRSPPAPYAATCVFNTHP